MSPTTLSPAPALARPGASRRPNLVIEWIVRLKWPFFIIVVMLECLAWNGQWRMSRDSSLYRAVAQNLLQGNGYTFRGEPERHAFPGLPLMLAGIDKVFGTQDTFRPTAAIAVVFALGLLTLVMVYRIVRLHFDEWIAVAVTCGVGANRIFLAHMHELLTDVPFLFGVCAAILGYEELLRAASDAASRRRRIRIAGSTLLLTVGLTFAASMRPTFYVLAGAWFAAGVWGLFRSPPASEIAPEDPGARNASPRLGHAIALGVLLLLGVGFLALTLGTRGNLFGVYERQALEKLRELAQTNWFHRLRTMFDEHVPDIFFGTPLIPLLNSIVSVIVLTCAALLIRVRVLWGVYAVGTILMTLLVANTARYFLMILPFMLIGWALFVQRLSTRFDRWRFGPEIVLWLGLAVVWLPNGIKCLGEIAIQHGITRTGVKPFADVYRDAHMRELIEVSRMIQERVKPHQKVLGPEPRIMSYLSGRQVFGLYELNIRKRKGKSLQAQAKELGISVGIFPADLYKHTDDQIAYSLMRKGFIHPGPERRRTEKHGMMLAPLIVEESPAAAKKWAQTQKKKNAKAARPKASTAPASRPALQS